MQSDPESTQPRSNDREQQINEVMAAYMQAAEKHGRQDRDDWLTQFPQYATELRERISVLEAFGLGANSCDDAGVASETTEEFKATVEVYPAVKGHDRIRVGSIIDGRYRVIEIKEGGMGSVLLVSGIHKHKQALLRQAALKLVMDYEDWAKRRHVRQEPSDKAVYSGLVNRFREEAMTWVRLGKHRNIIHALHVAEFGTQPYLCMEYADSGDVGAWIREGRMSASIALDFAIQCCEGMKHVASLGLIHRDIKPSNILIHGNQIAKVTDFGLSKWDTSEQTGDRLTTQTSHLVSAPGGTRSYMPPEQFVSLSCADERSDVFSFGATLFEMLTGQQVFRKQTSLEIARTQVCPPLIHEVNPEIPWELSQIVGKCLRFAPDERYANFGQLLEELVRFRETSPLGNTVIAKEQITQKGRSFIICGRREPDSVTLGEYGVDEPRWRFEQEIFSLISLGRFRDAVTIASRAVIEDAEFDGHWINKGKAHGELNEYREAAECFTRATELNPCNALAWANLAFAYHGIALAHKGVEAATKAIALDAKLAEAWHANGLCKMVLGHLDEASQSLTTALELNRYDWRIAANLGICGRRQERWSESARHLKIALHINPRSANLWLELGLSLRDDHEEALRCVDQSLSLDPNQSVGWVTRAAILWDSGAEMEEVVRTLDRALSLDPQSVEALSLLHVLTYEYPFHQSRSGSFSKSAMSAIDCTELQDRSKMKSVESTKSNQFNFHCPSCHRRLNASINLIGKTAKCPQCSRVVTVPAPTAASPAEVARAFFREHNEPWLKFKQFVRVRKATSESEILGNMRFQFMFPDRQCADSVLATLPHPLRKALECGQLWYHGPACLDERRAAGWIQLAWDRVHLSIIQGKQLMNCVVDQGGEIYEAFLT